MEKVNKNIDIPNTIILDDKDGYKIMSAEAYHYKKSGIRFNYSHEGWHNLLLNKEGIAVEKFNPARKYLDNERKKVHLDNEGNKITGENIRPKERNKNQNNNSKDLYIEDLIQHTEEQKIKRIKKEKKASNIFNIILTGILLLLSYGSVYFYGLNEFFPGLAAGFLIVTISTFVAIKIFDSKPYIPFFKKNFIAIIVASIVLTNFYFLIGGGPGFSDRPCHVNAFACE